jgi:hypothetical protein
VEKPKISDLVSLSLFQLDPRVSSSKKALWRSLVETAMYYEAKPLQKQQLCNAVTSLLEQPNVDITGEVDTALEGCIAVGSVVADDAVFKLTSIGLARVDELVKRARSDEKSFDDGLANCIASELGYSASQNGILVITSAVKYVVQEIFRTKGVEIERLRTKESLTLEEVMRAGAEYDPLVAIKQKLKTMTTLFGRDAEERVLSGIRKHFRQLNTESRRYITFLYNKVFYHQILNLDPSLHAHQRQYFNRTRLYLDTNMLITYLFEWDIKHKVALELVGASKALGCQAMVSPATFEEMKVWISGAQKLYAPLGNDKRIERLLTETESGKASNSMLVTFFMKRKENPDLLWDNYVAPYLKLEELLFQNSILVESEEYANVRTDKNYSKVWDTIRRIRYEEYPDDIVFHDADNFVLIHRLRQIHGPHPMGETVWLLTLDSNLCIAEKQLSQSYPSPHCYMLEDWGQVLLPYQGINNFAFQDYVFYLVRSGLGIAVDVDGLDLDFLETLHRPEFDVDLLLSLDDPSYVAECLATMQQNRNIRMLVRTARAAKAPEEIGAINRQLSSELLQTMVNTQKSSQAEADQLAGSVQKLEKRLYEIETRTIWQRIKALFNPP